MENFAAIDFETANRERSSVCSVGIVIVKDGKIADKIYRLIRPYPNYYSYWNTQVHGLPSMIRLRLQRFPRYGGKSLPELTDCLS